MPDWVNSVNEYCSVFSQPSRYRARYSVRLVGSFLSFDCNVVRGTPRRAAAPLGPPNRPPESLRTWNNMLTFHPFQSLCCSDLIQLQFAEWCSESRPLRQDHGPFPQNSPVRARCRANSNS